ncbi:MAG: GNAT family N-acetyltransferase [Massiliimalia sp.]|jgi:GNAT superfamily N-acetyltransferase
MNYQIIRLADKPTLKETAAHWFHQKWGIPATAYLESMEAGILGDRAVPQWYLAVKDDRIIAGMGVIENDFHNRKDLTPNVCAVYTEEDCRGQGIAGALLHYVCEDMKKHRIHTLYLITDLTAFYERYGWKFLCMVQGDDDHMSRMYIHTEPDSCCFSAISK